MKQQSKKTAKASKALAGYVVRLGKTPKSGPYVRLRPRVKLVRDESGKTLVDGVPKADDFTDVLCRELRYASVFMPDERIVARALARKWQGRVVRLVCRRSSK